LADNMGNAANGVHLGALGGLWQAAVVGVAGLELREDGIAVDPHLLPGWTEMAFPMQWRERLVRLRFEADPLLFFTSAMTLSRPRRSSSA
jgi:trehalose/maltose hydrolase-like predicted phosphorylase